MIQLTLPMVRPPREGSEMRIGPGYEESVEEELAVDPAGEDSKNYLIQDPDGNVRPYLSWGRRGLNSVK